VPSCGGDSRPTHSGGKPASVLLCPAAGAHVERGLHAHQNCRIALPACLVLGNEMTSSPELREAGGTNDPVLAQVRSVSVQPPARQSTLVGRYSSRLPPGRRKSRRSPGPARTARWLRPRPPVWSPASRPASRRSPPPLALPAARPRSR
jgi:hypothetical protein